MTSSAALSDAAVRMLRTAAGRRALQVALLVGGVLVLGFLCGERAYAADGVRASAGSAVGRLVSGQESEPLGSGAGGAQLVRAVGERAVGVAGDARASGGGELVKAPAKLPTPPKAPSGPGRPDRPSSPGLSGAPDRPDQPDVPNQSDLSDAPPLPDLSDAPPLPDLPDSSALAVPPKVPALLVPPKAPTLPAAPKAPRLPTAPKTPTLPVPPTAPSVPALPALPTLPDAPPLPDLPGLPDLPSLPGPPAPPNGDIALPGMPAEPGLPGYPAPPSHPLPAPLPTPALATVDPQPADAPASRGASPSPTRDATPEAHGVDGEQYGAPYAPRAARDHTAHDPAHHVRRAARTGPSASAGGVVPVGHVPGGRPDGTLCNRSMADNGTPRHGDTHAVTPSGRAPLGLVRGVAARACVADTRDGHRDIPVFPG
ncbi:MULTISPECIES: hypothetical protein [Streptomyces]|uniref:Uncharacterized protein n=1 Tax=Streptomyces koelreuteriae TaxID=2838015 RepID=A0ABX8FR67_9ACTN|nr:MULTISPECIES: hypothetical protein [Streptomyces]QWB23550.1 hypothetical protein KJK29_13575 [Streptomyces koelreuteriae]UUA06508.1 hypothetical protein NNW98_13635 [Streptomyces koelreuteriae]UUA14137.1 hypothetical protein NNW99_13635 [Streptomyces sp. CRCS-T-1]